jgi:putative membrane protein
MKMQQATSPFDAARWGWVATAVHAFLTLVSIGAFAVMIGRPIPTTADPDWWRASYQWGMTYMGALVLVLGFLGALFALWDAAGRRAALRAACWVVGFTLTIELIGAATGLPFGEHAYGGDLGWRVFGLVPFTIPLSWFLMLYATTGLALRAGLAWRGTAVLATVGLLAYDVLLEPAMSAAYPFWIWRDGGTWHGMPIANWMAWATIGPLIGWMLHRAAGASLGRIAATRQPDLIYLVNGLLPLAMAVRYELYGAAMVGGGAMACFAATPPLLSWARRHRAGAGAVAAVE